ncbi:DUF4870 domain-containing protein [Bacillus chungangensis]|uniref:DUF4870 domain-containing protein n=1 Tax=Bacillus chungangensis TaxID=587633 RepID=UPI0027D81A02|nr:DUF4870 domain-containing protein [Bacillus chungangensis]
MTSTSNKTIAALCYFSILFAPFIVPIIVFFVTEDDFVKKHAKNSFISHLIPILSFPLLIMAIFMDFHSLYYATGFPIFMIITVVLSILVNIIVFIWNLYRGIKLVV